MRKVTKHSVGDLVVLRGGCAIRSNSSKCIGEIVEEVMMDNEMCYKAKVGIDTFVTVSDYNAIPLKEYMNSKPNMCKLVEQTFSPYLD